ncbi:MAG: hypothetical protein ABJK20_03340 [Halieaceae bacterium]
MLDAGKLHAAEAAFLAQFPQGFADPEMAKIGKKHRMTPMIEFARESFSDKALQGNVHLAADNMVKAVSRSSMVSLFEKPKFRDFVKAMDEHEKAFLVNALRQQLHGKQAGGFEAMIDILKTGKLAKWSLSTIIPAYYKPTREVFVKPTTAKGILKFFDIADPVYHPTPTWEFYRKYRKLINDGKKEVSKSLSPSNAAFSGFLMMTVLPGR